jgi:lysophospholipase L1-like esterase
MNDNFCYYNVVIDDTIRFVFHPTVWGLSSYTLRNGLPEGHHTIKVTKRNETNWTKFSFNGFVLDDGKTLLTPVDKPARKIEFIGDSFTCASGNEWTSNESAPPSDAYTNIDEGFGAIIAGRYDAQFHLTGASGFGLIQDWQGNTASNLPAIFDRALEYTSQPKWDFSQWIPDLVVICLGLNDFNGWHGYDSLTLPNQNKDFFQTRYHEFIDTIRSVYPGTKILAVSAHPDWLQSTIAEVVEQEQGDGKIDISYAWFPYYPGGYVNFGHPNVDTHHRIADTLIAVIDPFTGWEATPNSVPGKGRFVNDNGTHPDKFVLYQNYPNPFNPSTVVNYSLAGVGNRFDVSLKVYDVLGREVATLVEGMQERGSYELTWDASNFSGGAYFIRLTSRDQQGSISRQTIKTLLIR